MFQVEVLLGTIGQQHRQTADSCLKSDAKFIVVYIYILNKIKIWSLVTIYPTFFGRDTIDPNAQ